MLKPLLMTLTLALVFAATAAGIDWYTNPANLFRSEQGTNWSILLETFLSWIIPLALLAVLVSAGLCATKWFVVHFNTVK